MQLRFGSSKMHYSLGFSTCRANRRYRKFVGSVSVTVTAGREGRRRLPLRGQRCGGYAAASGGAGVIGVTVVAQKDVAPTNLPALRPGAYLEAVITDAWTPIPPTHVSVFASYASAGMISRSNSSMLDLS